MTDIHCLPVSLPELYVTHSQLAEARIPMGATVTHIYRAARWRRIDERMGDGYSRRQRTRARKANRQPFTFVDNAANLAEIYTAPPSHKGYAA
jgi:hypothetical protein